jgi:hypothetical protein
MAQAEPNPGRVYSGESIKTLAKAHIEEARARIGVRIVFEGDNATTKSESVVALLEIWKRRTQEEAAGVWDPFHDVDKICS